MVPTRISGVQPASTKTPDLDEILLGLAVDLIPFEAQTPPPAVTLRAEWAIKLPTPAHDALTEGSYFRSQEDINLAPSGTEATIYLTRAAAAAVRDMLVWAADTLLPTPGQYRPRLVTRAVMLSADQITVTPWQLVDEDGER